ncbi:MAG TPA: phenylalanine--tRNA ligase subunit beta [Phnomibacter sp.]|nr:phenylalanine--tRNA ligase subunit beta [Phnomibacter sp.]
MTISYKWLCEYLPIGGSLPEEWVEPEKLSKVLTAVGLEVESLEPYESLKGGLKGLVIGEVMDCEKHPDADKLSVTKVNIGEPEHLQIVCGAPNVAKGQKVVVATIGATIYPVSGEPLTMKKAKIRGVESHGMICAQDEIGLADDHAGIMVLDATAVVGTPAATYFNMYTDWVYEIGLTPNRMDAMSHLGVARDVCAYLSHHHNRQIAVKTPLRNTAVKPTAATKLPIAVEIENAQACQRYSGVSITGVSVKESPQWLQDKLKSIGLRPINNVVDITNFILHETGQPLHAFDAQKIAGAKVLVKNLAEETPFISLDEKERKLSAEDLMICDGNSHPMCIGGVFGGLDSGVSTATTQIFLESAWFQPVSIRKSSFRHGLRTDAATRFEKGVDISQTVNVLKRAANLIIETGGGEIASDIVDVYHAPQEKKQVAIKYHYLKKLSGKNYHPDAVKNILESLGFEFLKEGQDDLWFAVPFSKPDVSLPADIVEEIMRIDGLDNVEIPSTIAIAPSADLLGPEEGIKEKLAGYLVGLGFHEILTNSITNSKYYSEEVLAGGVRMLNNLSADLDMMRPSMLEVSLETIVNNLNRKNNHLQFFEFGKTYHAASLGVYSEKKRLNLLVTGDIVTDHWRQKKSAADIFYVKGVVSSLLQLLGVPAISFAPHNDANISGLAVHSNNTLLGVLGVVAPATLRQFDIKQTVLFVDLSWETIADISLKQKISYKELAKFPAVGRDLALVVPKAVSYAQVEAAVQMVKLPKLTGIKLFDVFESEKLGADKKSLAVNFTFQDSEKTMTDADIENMMNKLMKTFEKELGAEIRK